MTVTMKDVASRAGVSSATVSKVLNGLDQHISQEKREEILHLIDEMGYVPNSMARGLKRRESKMLGFILPDITNPFFPEIVRGIEDEAREHGFGVLVCNTDNDASQEEKAFRFLESKMIDGIIFTHSVHESPLKFLADSQVPVVIVDRIAHSNNPSMSYGQIFVDAKQGICDSTKYLLSKGCTHIGFISGENKEDSDRFQGFLMGMHSMNAKVYKSLLYFGQYDMKTGTEGAKAILCSRVCLDGLICGNDLIAIGAIAGLQKAGYKVPDDVKVFGFDDIYMSNYIKPGLSTVHQPAYEMGHEAAKMIIDHILNKKELSKKMMEYKLVYRDSA
ncbi:MAG: LacI family DNA-binding transcriptional regulator [Stecheria intestinalis]|nr:LacI family DNA-binding transcriptional regulator [Stecheria intestinalis]